MNKLESMMNKFAEQLQQLNNWMVTLETNQVLQAGPQISVDTQFASPTSFINRNNKHTMFTEVISCTSTESPASLESGSSFAKNVGNSQDPTYL